MIEAVEVHEPKERVSRVVTISIPLPWLLSTAAGVLWALVSMYFTVNQSVRTLEELQITVKSGNTAMTTLQSEQTIMRIRFENLESTVKHMQSERRK